MDKKVEDHQYAPEFTEEVSIITFLAWVLDNATGFSHDLVRLNKINQKPLYTWISWFLDWSEYNDFMEWKKEVEENG